MDGAVVFCMKEWWSCAQYAFADPLSVHRSVREVREAGAYREASARVFREERLADVARYR